MKNKFMFEHPEEFYPTEMDDDSVLADGMIPDSRIIGLIDELDITDEDYDADDEDSEMALKSIGMKLDDE